MRFPSHLHVFIFFSLLRYSFHLLSIVSLLYPLDTHFCFFCHFIFSLNLILAFIAFMDRPSLDRDICAFTESLYKITSNTNTQTDILNLTFHVHVKSIWANFALVCLICLCLWSWPDQSCCCHFLKLSLYFSLSFLHSCLHHCSLILSSGPWYVKTKHSNPTDAYS